jgi:hypothetical protein
MDDRGISAGRVLIFIAALLVTAVLVFLGQMGFAFILLAVAVVIGIAMLFSRARTPTD